MIRLIPRLLLLFLPFLAFAQTEEIYFRLPIHDKSEVDQLTRLISIDNVEGNSLFGYANDIQWERLLHLGYRPERLPHPGSLYEHQMSLTIDEFTEDWDTYPTYQGYLDMMAQYAGSFPDICRLDTFGVSVQGRLLLAMKISDNPGQEEDEPEFLYTSTMHGDETVGYVLMLRLIDYLLNQYGQPTPEGERVTRLVNEMEIWINPLFNPDGTYKGGNHTVTGAIRGNAHFVDLNRDFPDRINDPNNTTVGREPETAAMMLFVAAHNFNLSANFHGGARVVNYPWDNGAPSGTYSACPDDAWFVDLSLTYSLTNPDLLTGGFPNGITNGCQWYAVFGGRQDWIYWWHGGRETTIELWNTKNPPGSALPQRWTNNKESFLAYMEEALKGIRGIVSDAITGEPLAAKIDIAGIPNVPVFTDPNAGDYHRLLRPGTYTVMVSAPDYFSDTLLNVVVVDTGAARLNVALWPVSSTVSFVQNLQSGWNLVGLPANPANRHYLSLYPQAIPNTLFGFNGAYQLEDSLQPGAGYWLRFAGNGSATITGAAIINATIELAEGWNLIAGISTPAALEQISDPQSIIVPGTLYGFSGSYVPSDTIKPGAGYWLKANAAGQISLGSPAPAQLLPKLPDVSQFPALQVHDSHSTASPGLHLYFGASLPEPAQKEYFALPPTPPAGAFDARFADGYRIAGGDRAEILLQSSHYPVIFRAANLPAGSAGGEKWMLEEIAAGESVARHLLAANKTIIIRDSRVTEVKLSRESGGPPSRFALEQNYPNPFNPGTTIRFGLPQPARVSLAVYNLLGERIRTLVNGQVSAGFHEIAWDGRDEAGRSVSSGVYLYRLETEGFSKAVKMLLLR